jgi:ABC-type branched-subunit amino acid transport system ATPase component
MTEPLLVLEAVEKHFGGVQAVRGVSFTVEEGQILGLIGPNGAGKSTVLGVVAGEIPADGGRILFAGKELRGGVPHRVARRGVVRTFQLAREWRELTVLENLLAAPYPQFGEHLAHALLSRRRIAREEEEKRALAWEILSAFRLTDLANARAVTLSGGQKKLLELARAMMTRPRLLLLDEPTAGVNPVLVDEIVEHIRTIRRSGVTVLLVEHNLGVVERVCDDVVVMALGRVLTRGSMQDLRRDPAVIEAYLGGGYGDGAA